jgi:hypothetical protein
MEINDQIEAPPEKPPHHGKEPMRTQGPVERNHLIDIAVGGEQGRRNAAGENTQPRFRPSMADDLQDGQDIGYIAKGGLPDYQNIFKVVFQG